MAKCSSCSCSCGDDHKTNTEYKEEKNVGDRLKVVLLQAYDMSSIDNLQIYEIKALFNALIDEHIEEYNEE